jgi:hypothetical protein
MFADQHLDLFEEKVSKLVNGWRLFLDGWVQKTPTATEWISEQPRRSVADHERPHNGRQLVSIGAHKVQEQEPCIMFGVPKSKVHHKVLSMALVAYEKLKPADEAFLKAKTV